MKYKCLNLISDNKWSNFSIEKQNKVLTQFFLEIEEILRENLYFEEQIYTKMDILIKNMERTKWNNSTDSYPQNKDWKFAYQLLKNLYNFLRDNFNNDLILQKDFHFLPNINILKKDKEKSSEQLPVILILDNLRSAFNVGSIIRTAECLNIREVWFCGYTPKPDNPKIKNTAMGTQNKIYWKHFSETVEAVNMAKKIGYQVYALETVENAESVYEQEFHGSIAFVVGNEALGISEEILLICEKCLILPIYGWKNSLNVATTCAVVCFEVLRQKSI